jgi:hypothetical protein
MTDTPDDTVDVVDDDENADETQEDIGTDDPNAADGEDDPSVFDEDTEIDGLPEVGPLDPDEEPELDELEALALEAEEGETNG